MSRIMDRHRARKTAKTPGLGSRISALRLSRGLNMKQLAELTGISDSYISQLERGYREPTAHKVGRLARVLGCTTDHLILGDTCRD